MKVNWLGCLRYEEFSTALVEAVIKKIRTEQNLDDEKTDDDVSLKTTYINYKKL